MESRIMNLNNVVSEYLGSETMGIDARGRVRIPMALKELADTRAKALVSEALDSWYLVPRSVLYSGAHQNGIIIYGSVFNKDDKKQFDIGLETEATTDVVSYLNSAQTFGEDRANKRLYLSELGLDASELINLAQGEFPSSGLKYYFLQQKGDDSNPPTKFYLASEVDRLIIGQKDYRVLNAPKSSDGLGSFHLDAQGRIKIPDLIQNSLGLEGKVLFMGDTNKIELQKP